MSKVKIQGNASGTGVVTLTAPNTDTDRTITLPDSTGTILDSTSTLDATKLSGALPAIDGSALTGTGSPSITDNGNAEAIHIDANENVGIGTSSPSQALEISGDAPIIRLTDTGASNNYSEINADYTSGSLQISADTADAISNSRIMFAVDNTERMRIDSDGVIRAGNLNEKLGGGSNFVSLSGNGYASLRVRRGSDTGNAVLFYGSNSNSSAVGSIDTSSSSTSYNTSSDYRLKENVVPMSASIDRLKALNPVKFNFIGDADTTVDGFLAHEAQEVVPEAVSGEKDAMRTEEYEVTPAVKDDDGNVVTEAVMGTREVEDYQGIDQSKLVPLLVASLQEAVEKIEALEARVTQLENN